MYSALHKVFVVSPNKKFRLPVRIPATNAGKANPLWAALIRRLKLHRHNDIERLLSLWIFNQDATICIVHC